MCERAELFDSGGYGEPRSTLFRRPSWPSAKDERVGPLMFDLLEALSPGPLTRPPTLRPVGRPTLRKGWPSRGWTPPGAGLARLAGVARLRSPVSSCRFHPAHPPL